MSKDKLHYFEDNNVHILDREDKRFEKDVQEALTALNKCLYTQQRWGSYAIYHAALSSIP